MATALADDGRRKILVLEARAGQKSALQRRAHPPARRRRARRARLPRTAARRPAAPTCAASPCVQSPDEADTLLPYDEIAGSRPHGFAIDHHDLVDTLRTQDARAARHRAAPGRARRPTWCAIRSASSASMTANGPDAGAAGRSPATGATRRSARSSRCPSARTLLSFTAAALLEDCPLPHPGFGHIFLGAWGPILVYPISGRTRAPASTCRADMDKGKEAVIARLRTGYAPHLPEGVRATLIARARRRRRSRSPPTTPSTPTSASCPARRSSATPPAARIR